MPPPSDSHALRRYVLNVLETPLYNTLSYLYKVELKIDRESYFSTECSNAKSEPFCFQQLSRGLCKYRNVSESCRRSCLTCCKLSTFKFFHFHFHNIPSIKLVIVITDRYREIFSKPEGMRIFKSSRRRSSPYLRPEKDVVSSLEI